MSQAELSVNFKSVGANTLKSELQGVGSAAQSSSTQIKSASTATEGLGKGMKGSVSSIGAVTTAFATLSLSIVNAYRSYRDLGDAQLAVDRANLKVSKTQNAIRLLEKDIAKDRKEGAKGSLNYAIASNKIVQAEQKLAADRKDGKHSAAELRGEELAIAKMRKDGVGNTQQLTDKETKLNLLREQLGIATTNAGEAQERFNDIQQNFYLSIAPLAISTIGTLTTTFGALKSSIGGAGAGGIIGSLGGLGLVLGGLSLGVIAYQNNWLGLKDKIGGVITWLKDRFGVWKDTIEKVFNLIKGGKWGEAFNLIKEAAGKFWADIKKSVPLLGDVESLVNKIKNGNWYGALLQIWKAATDVWNIIKKNIPILGKVEDAINAISQGKWGEAFQKIADAAKEVFTATLGKGIAFFFGENWKLKFDAAVALMLAEATVNKVHPIVQLTVDVNATIAKVTGFDILAWFKAHPITAQIPFAGGITMAIDDPKFRGAIALGSTIIIKALGEALTRIAGTLDPYFSEVIKALNWNNVINTVGSTIKLAGEGIWNFIFSGIKTGFVNQDWTKIFGDLNKTVNEWWATNFPDVQKQIIENFKQSPLGQITVPFIATPEVDKNTPQIINKAVNPGRGQYKVPINPDTSQMPAKLKTQLTGVVKSQHPIVKIDANLAAANAKWAAFAKKVQMTTLQVKIAGTSANIRTGSQAGAYGGSHAGGLSKVVSQPTLMMVGEGGRDEKVSVTPIGSSGHSGDSGGGGFNGTINVFVDGVKEKARYEINKFQGVIK